MNNRKRKWQNGQQTHGGEKREYVNLKVSVFEEDYDFSIRVRKSDKLGRWMNFCADRIGFPYKLLSFQYGCGRIHDQTPKELGMEEDDEIEVFRNVMGLENLIIKVGGETFPGPYHPVYSRVDHNGNLWVHKEVLAYKSDVFAFIFRGLDGYSTFNFNEATASTVRSLLDYFYNLPLENSSLASADLFKAAHKYKLPELELMCENALVDNVDEQNCTELILLASQFSLTRLHKACLLFSIEHMHKICGNSSRHHSSSTLMLLRSFSKGSSVTK